MAQASNFPIECVCVDSVCYLGCAHFGDSLYIASTYLYCTHADTHILNDDALRGVDGRMFVFIICQKLYTAYDELGACVYVRSVHTIEVEICFFRKPNTHEPLGFIS